MGAEKREQKIEIKNKNTGKLDSRIGSGCYSYESRTESTPSFRSFSFGCPIMEKTRAISQKFLFSARRRGRPVAN